MLSVKKRKEKKYYYAGNSRHSRMKKHGESRSRIVPHVFVLLKRLQRERVKKGKMNFLEMSIKGGRHKEKKKKKVV